MVEVVESLDLGDLERAYAGKGSAAYRPALLSLLIYGYATGCYSSRKIEQATYDALAVRYIACNRHPDHDTPANLRERFGKEFEAVFVKVLQVARENQLSRFGRVSLDGTKIHANAGRRCALSYGYAEAIEAHLQAKVQELLALAEQADGAKIPDGMSVPEELNRREDRLAAECYAREQADYQAKLAARGALRQGQWQEARWQGPQAPRARSACRGPDQPHR